MIATGMPYNNRVFGENLNWNISIGDPGGRSLLSPLVRQSGVN